MNIERPLLLPVAASLGAHALLFLGFTAGEPEVIAGPSEDPPMVELTFVRPPDDEPLEVPKGTDRPEREKEAVSVPALPELIRVVSNDDGPIMEPTKPVPFAGTPVKNIPPAWTPEGESIGPKGPPVFPAHLLDNEPKARFRSAPVYPFEAKRNGVRGEVVVEFEVNERGEVMSPRVVRSTDSIFEAPTLRAVSKWTFEPGRKDGRAVRFRMMIPIVFNLHE